MSLFSHETKKKAADTLGFCAQRIPGLILIFLLSFAFIGPLFVPYAYWILTLFLYIFLVSNAVRVAVGLVVAAIKTKIHTETDWSRRFLEYVESKGLSLGLDRLSAISHIIIIPNYKEDYDTLFETLDTLACHENAVKNYRVILAMEASETGCAEKANKLIESFAHRFQTMKYTVHPAGIPGESRGKSSNVAWAAVYYADNWLRPENIQNEIFTVLDADTQLTQKYFECIAYKYCTSTEEEQHRVLYAPVLAFDRNANRVSFIVRVADICWSIGLMANFQLAVKFPCSVYSVSLLLARSVNYWDAGPEAIGEDFHMAMKCWTSQKMNLKMTPIFIPASCSNVQGDTYFGSIGARFQQSKRHLWGVVDFGYAFTRLITQGCWHKNFFKSFLCLYILFEIFYQPFFGFYQLTGQYLFPQSVPGFGEVALQIMLYIRIALIPPAIITTLAFERYHFICCHYRESILLANKEREALSRSEEDLVARPQESQENLVGAPPRPNQEVTNLIAYREWYQIADWVALPLCLVGFYVIPGMNAMIWQLYTNKLDYKVSLKPTSRIVASAVVLPTPETSNETSDADCHSVISKSDSSFEGSLKGTKTHNASMDSVEVVSKSSV